MKIVGLQKNSFVDYPKNIAAVLFLAGCNFRCWYCHNADVCADKTGISYNQDEILSFMQKRQKMLDGVVITGGEPLKNDDLAPLLKQIKALGYKVKLDTNGMYPHRLAALVNQGLIDYIAMDIKATESKYAQTAGVAVDFKTLQKSIKYIMACGVAYEFRTTVVPQLTMDDLKEMAGYINGAKTYALQQYRKPQKLNGNMLPLPLKPSFFSAAKDALAPLVQNVILRGL